MEIKQIDSRRLKILLSGEDLDAINLSYEQIDYQNPETREFLFSLLETACLTTEFKANSRVAIEIYPTNQRGCVVYFSALDDPPKRWKVRRHIVSPAIYLFDDVDTLIKGSVKLFHRASHRILKSSLYRGEGRYWLVIYPLDMVENITLAFLDEYASRCGEGLLVASWLDEHAQLILKDHAVDLLCSYFG